MWHRTRPAPIAIGIRKAPAPEGVPGYIRIDTVHRGDLDGMKGVYQGLMRCYTETDRHAEGVAVYRQLEQIFSVILGVAPSPASRVLGQQLLKLG